MDVFLFCLAILAALLATIGSVLPILPGPLLAYGSLWIARYSGYCDFSPTFMWTLTAITAVVFAADYVLPTAITRKMGGSRAAGWGAAIGMILGVFLTPVGMILGMLIGAFVGEMIFAGNSTEHSVRAAMGAFLGFLLSSGIKLMLCFYVLYKIIFTAIG